MSSRPSRVPRHRSLRVLAGGVALAGATLLAGAAPALAAPLDDAAGPADSAEAADVSEAGSSDVVPAPAPTAPPIAPSWEAFAPGDVLNQLSDLAPAGLPLPGLVQSAAGATKIIPG